MIPLPPRALGMLLLAASLVQAAPQAEESAPRLVLQITIDQLRGDIPQRYYERFGEGGFRFLMDKGAHYTAAHFAHAITKTAPGHATLFTGANPREHGIVGNEWYDAEMGRMVYNCEDDQHHVIGAAPRPREGVSPSLLRSSTITDEFVVAGNGNSRAFSVSIKDRGAILPGGHLGKAFWYARLTGEFVTSTYYYDEYPEWVQAWNDSKPADAYRGKSWELSRPRDEYLAQEDDRECEIGYLHLGTTFPHSLDTTKTKDFYNALRKTPMGDELTVNFARRLLVEEKLGQEGARDFLALSLSVTDGIGHVFGPQSLEAEDNLLRLDALLADLFQTIDASIGLEHTLIVLSSDHGACEASRHLASLGCDAGWVDGTALLDECNAELRDYFEVEEDLIEAHVTPYLWLDFDAIEFLELDPDEVAEVAAIVATESEGVEIAHPRWLLDSGTLSASPLNDRLLASFHPDRSGEVYLVSRQQWLIEPGRAWKSNATVHGSPWSYDTHVPIFFVGAGIEPGDYARPVAPRDIAPTLALMLGTKIPSGATGTPLRELLD